LFSLSLHKQCATISRGYALVMIKREAVVGHNNTQVGGHDPTGTESGRPVVKHVTHSSDGREPAAACETPGEMTQQSRESGHGHDSTPQKLLQLVGCREPKAVLDSWRRLRRNRSR
jgi:hypothetical protein